MWKRPIIIVLSFLVCWQMFGQRADRLEYIERYKKIAIKEMERAGVPASIKLAQALLESNAGQSTLARRANNHFGMKCGSAWEGKTYEKEDDDYDANGNLIKSCFRVYKNAETSFVAHSEFLRDPNKSYRYGFLFRLDPTDYKAWAHGLKKAGYATSPTYAQNIINTIETYELFRYDLNIEDLDEDVVEIVEEVPTINDVKVAFAREEETPAEVSLRTGVSISRILKYNERLNSPAQELRKNERVYLQRKRGSYRGKKKYHFVKDEETMFSISQMYGLRLEKLYKKNKMEEGTQPAVKEQIKIRGWRVSDPPRLRDDADPGDIFDGPDVEWDNGEPGNADDDSGFEIDFPDPPSPPDIDNSDDDTDIDEDDTYSTPVYHTVIRGETLFGLSRKYGSSVEDIKRLNGLDGNVISIGQVLRVK